MSVLFEFFLLILREFNFDVNPQGAQSSGKIGYHSGEWKI
jgi:hypothetical protein